MSRLQDSQNLGHPHDCTKSCCQVRRSLFNGETPFYLGGRFFPITWENDFRHKLRNLFRPKPCGYFGKWRRNFALRNFKRKIIPRRRREKPSFSGPSKSPDTIIPQAQGKVTGKVFPFNGENGSIVLFFRCL